MRKIAAEAFVVEFIKRIRERDRGIGGGKLWRMYQKEFGEDHSVGYNRFYDIVEKYGLKVRKRRRRAKTTDSNHDLPTYPNLVKDLIPIRPNQLWVSDITYMIVYVDESSGEYKFCYLSLVTDYYTKEIVGWCVGDTLEAKFAIEALDMAMRRLDKNAVHDIIHHSDRGVQYCCDAYVERLRRHGIAISMTEDYKPTDNAVAERINGIIKVERLYRQGLFETIERAASVIERYIYFYNYRRPHMSVGYKTPGIVHGEKETQIKMWRNKRKPVKSNEKEMDTIALQSRTTNLSEGLCSAQR